MSHKGGNNPFDVPHLKCGHAAFAIMGRLSNAGVMAAQWPLAQLVSELSNDQQKTKGRAFARPNTFRSAPTRLAPG
jgi:hypothetical protein